MALGNIDPMRNVSGFNYRQYSAFVDGLSAATTYFPQWLQSWATTQALKINREAKKRTPIYTGDLLNSWISPKIEMNGTSVKITFENTAPYSGWVEYGHAKPYKSGVGEGDADWVDGKFMITVPLQIFLDDVNKQFGLNFTKWLQSYLSGNGSMSVGDVEFIYNGT